MHHGYQWLDPKDFILGGVVRSVFYGNPHINFRVEAADGIWFIESTDVLGATLAGFEAGTLKVGDQVTVYGFKASGSGDRRMRGDKVEVRGRVYVLLPREVFGPPFGGAPLPGLR